MQDVPIIGQTPAQPQQFSDDSISSIVNLYDSEFLAAESLWKLLRNKWQERSTDLDALTKEMIERFRDIGLVIRVNWYQGGSPDANGKLQAIPGCYIPEMVIQSRVQTKGQFDHDQMAWEVQNNILELPGVEKGKIAMSSAEARALIKKQREHKHQH